MKTPREIDEAYGGREHSRIKHLILEAYLERLLMIVGQAFTKIAYVDAFAGPWKSQTADYSDASFGVASRVINECRSTLRERLHKNVRIRSLFIDEDSEAIEKIRAHAPDADVWHGRFEELACRIPDWLERDEFAFVFVDPWGWKDIVEPRRLAPLLRRPRTELLINIMWDHIRMATGHDNQMENLAAVFGPDPVANLPHDSVARQQALMRRYRTQLKEHGRAKGVPALRTLMIPIEYVDKATVKFFLVYATHSATGINTFGEESEKVQAAQHALKFMYRLQKKEEKTGVGDLFGTASTPEFSGNTPFADALELWRARLALSSGALEVDDEVMADLVEAGDLLPSELQGAAGRLIQSGEVDNPSIKRPRKKNWVKWRESERLIRLK